MNWDALIPLLITTIVALLGWFVVHYLAAKREHIARRHDTRIQFVMRAYQRLEGGLHRGPIYGTAYASDIESALADIQLLGTSEQIELARRYSSDLASCGETDASDLLESLRQSLRLEVGLAPADGKIFHHRFARDNKEPTKRCSATR